MNKYLVCYFSASGVTKKCAENLANVLNGDLLEIAPVKPYSAADLNWQDKRSRSSIEMQDINCRPEMQDINIDISNYDTIFLGYPIWWYTAPRIINTFLEKYDFSGKTIIPFCTSGGSGIDESIRDLKNMYPNYIWHNGKRLTSNVDKSFIENWLK